MSSHPSESDNRFEIDADIHRASTLPARFHSDPSADARFRERVYAGRPRGSRTRVALESPR